MRRLTFSGHPAASFVTGQVSLMSNADVPYDDAPLDDIYRDGAVASW